MLGATQPAWQPAREAAFRAAPEDDVVRLSREEAWARHELGRAAARFIAVKGWERLAFARLGDYSSERLGMSGRELQSFAFVASRLGGLPLLTAAFLHGEISWSQTRLLCAVETPESEASWLERARGLTVRELVVEVRRSRAPLAPDAADALDDEPTPPRASREPSSRSSAPQA